MRMFSILVVEAGQQGEDWIRSNERALRYSSERGQSRRSRIVERQVGGLQPPSRLR